MSKMVRDIARFRDIDARLSIDTIIVDGHSIANPTMAPEHWRLGRACPKRAEYAAALGWTKLRFPLSSHSAYTWLLGRERAIIIPAHLSFYLPGEKQQSMHRSIVFWRYPKRAQSMTPFDGRICSGIQVGEQRISCCPPVCADATKLLSLVGGDLIALTPEQLAELKFFGTIKMGCGEGWKGDGSYTHPSTHHPPFCMLDEASRFGKRRPEHRQEERTRRR